MNEKKDHYRPLPPLLQKRLEHLASEIEREKIAAAKTEAAITITLLVAFFATLAILLAV
jgi:hypothetical protein